MAKKKYSIHWEDDLPVSFEVNGVEYKELEDIPDEDARRKLEAMIESAEDAEFDAEFNDPEFEKMRKDVERFSAVPVEKIVLWMFTGVAVLMLLITGIASYKNILKINREERAPGIVVDVVMEREYINEQDRIVREYYFPVVEFVAQDGKRRSLKMSEGSDPPSYEMGDEVTVLYDPDHPLDARIQSIESSALMWVLPGITGILGICFLAAVMLVQRVMLREEKDESAIGES
ncbi:MAG TPA: DUF3592 domain-containing protein [Anaerolineales bacterium]|nr:DUF3592 domain-containing protein [Anaerolineales bacterium]